MYIYFSFKELERISAKDAIEDPFISVSVKLEQYLMEGTYNKVIIFLRYNFEFMNYIQ